MTINNPSNIKVSVIVPVYNVEHYLRQCLDSLKSQTLNEIEFIIIDDCSTDSCGAICDEYAATDNRFIVIHNEINIRQGLSRNKGIEKAKGEYVGFVDADDWIDTDYYEKLYHAAKLNRSDIAKTEVVFAYADGRQETQTEQNIFIQEGINTGKPIFLSFGYEHCSAIYKREILIKNHIRYPDIRNAQDNIFLLRFNYSACSIALISNTKYFYRQNPSSTISIREKPYFDSILEWFELHLDFINQNSMPIAHYNAVFQRAIWLVRLRYLEIKTDNEWIEYKKEYVLKVMEILLKYKVDPGLILDLVYYGFTKEKDTQQQQINVKKCLKNIILWMPKQILKLARTLQI